MSACSTSSQIHYPSIAYRLKCNDQVMNNWTS